MLRLGAGERGVTEILGLAEHVASLSAVAAGLRVRPDVPAGPDGPSTELLAPVDDPAAEAAGTLGEIGSWSREALGTTRAPAFWRVLARRPRLLEVEWAKHRLVLGAGRLDEAAKVAVALACAMNRQSAYWSGYFSALGRRSGALDDEAILDIAGCTAHYVSFNTIAHGMRLDAPHDDLDSRNLPPA